jgi:hypothetical protein
VKCTAISQCTAISECIKMLSRKIDLVSSSWADATFLVLSICLKVCPNEMFADSAMIFSR